MEKSKKYNVRLTGATPLLLKNHNIEWLDVMQQWEKDPANKKRSVAGDDRSPAHRWIGCLYVDGGNLVVPSDNLMTMLREGGTMCRVGKGAKTYQKQTQTGILIDQVGWSLTKDGKTAIPYAPLHALIEQTDFAKHEAVCKKHGFWLFVKGATVNNKRHVRVRPRFDAWQLAGSLTVLDDQITEGVLRNILTFAGENAGLGDWRPSSKKPGWFGKFSATVEAAMD